MTDEKKEDWFNTMSNEQLIVYTKDSQTNIIIKKPNFKACTKIKWSNKKDMKNHKKCNCYFVLLHVMTMIIKSLINKIILIKPVFKIKVILFHISYHSFRM